MRRSSTGPQEPVRVETKKPSGQKGKACQCQSFGEAIEAVKSGLTDQNVPTVREYLESEDLQALGKSLAGWLRRGKGQAVLPPSVALPPLP